MKIIVFDIETTGLDKVKDSIIQFAAIKFDTQTNQVIEEFTQLRNRMHEKGELPIRHIGGIQVVLLNQIYKRYFLYRLASLLYVDVLVPYILPHLGRN